ncbi:MAG: glycosyltransferase family 1 protein [Crocinitomicaceae bacterium]
MRIAINTRFLLKSKMEGFGWFTYETVKRMVESHPEHEFYFYFDRKYDDQFIFGENVKAFVFPPQARHPLLFKLWFNHSITRALRKHQPDVFLSPDGYLSLRTSTPQIAVIHDLNFEHHPEDLPKAARNYLKTYFPKFAEKAKHIITVSEFSKKDIVNTYGISPNKITVAYNGASDAFVPLSEAAKKNAREKFAGGQEYFVFVGALHPRKNVNRLFEAFDQFKKESNSKTHLVIVGEKLWKDQSVEEAYEKMQFKNEVHFTGHLPLERLAKAVGGAKALVFPSYFEGFGIPLVEAMKADCPILCGNLTALPEIAGDAAILINPYSVTDISSGLEKIDQDEALRKQLIEKGRERAKAFSWDTTAEKIWEVVENTVHSGK